MPLDSSKKNLISFDFEAPRIKYAIDSSNIQTLRVASIKFNRKVSEKGAIEISTNGIAYEHRFLKKEYFEFGAINKIGGGSEGDVLEGIEDESSLFYFISLAQVNWRPPFQKLFWVGAGLEYDIRSYTNSYSELEDGKEIKSINILERDIFFVENLMMNYKNVTLYASAYSAPSFGKSVYEIKNRDDDDEGRTGISKRKKSDFSYRYGLSFNF